MKLRNRSVLPVIAAALLLAPALAVAQPGPGVPPPTAQSEATADLTGTWVSVVTEDWLWRMITPPVGDVASIPLNDAGVRAAESWDRERDIASGDQCKAWGAAGLMRIPTRVRMSWEDGDTLRLETDSGTQTRRFHFNSAGAAGAPSLQGYSVASWDGANAGGGGGVAGGLTVTTTNMTPGYLRKNGVPYSANARLTEYFDRHSDFGDEWFTVTTVVDDPEYLSQPFITSTHFKREPDDSMFNPAPCITDPPLIDEPVEN